LTEISAPTLARAGIMPFVPETVARGSGGRRRLPVLGGEPHTHGAISATGIEGAYGRHGQSD
jgi:hypothetical protein